MTYTYAIEAYDAAGNLSGASVLKSITPNEKPTKPGSFAISSLQQEAAAQLQCLHR